MKLKTEFLALSLLCSPVCLAYDWYIDPGFNFSERYTNNLRLLVPSPNTTIRDNFISTFSPNAHFGYLSDNSEGNLTFQWNQSIYHGEESLNFGEKILNLSHIYKGGERWKITSTGKFAVESTVTTQLDVNSGGFVGAQLPRTTRSISPDFTYQLSEKNTLDLGVSYLDVAFDRHPNGALIDYASDQIFSTLTHTYSSRLSLNLNGSYSLYNAGGGAKGTYQTTGNFGVFTPVDLLTNVISSQNSKTTSIQLGMQYQWLPTTLVSASAGIRQTDSQSSIQYVTPGFNCNPHSYAVYNGNIIHCPLSLTNYSNNAAGNIYSASVRRTFERGNLLLSVNQQLNPASTGSQQQSTSFTANGQYELSERWSMGISGLYQTTETVTSTQNSSIYNRNFYNITPNVQWKWTPDINLQLSYIYNNQHYTTTNTTATADSMMLQLIYQPPINRQVK